MRLVSEIARRARGQRGVTGLETAIIMISFVTVASIFAYTVLSAGIFSASKGQQAVTAGLNRAGSTLQIIGPIVAEDTNGDDNVDQIVFIVSTVMAGSSIDFTHGADSNSNGLFSDEATQTNSTIINYFDDNQALTDLSWSTTQIGKGNNDSVLDYGEKFEVTVSMKALSPALTSDETFTMEVHLRDGTTLSFERSTGAVIDKVNELN